MKKILLALVMVSVICACTTIINARSQNYKEYVTDKGTVSIGMPTEKARGILGTPDKIDIENAKAQIQTWYYLTGKPKDSWAITMH